jgi:hypothetical protein
MQKLIPCLAVIQCTLSDEDCLARSFMMHLLIHKNLIRSPNHVRDTRNLKMENVNPASNSSMQMNLTPNRWIQQATRWWTTSLTPTHDNTWITSTSHQRRCHNTPTPKGWYTRGNTMFYIIFSLVNPSWLAPLYRRTARRITWSDSNRIQTDPLWVWPKLGTQAFNLFHLLALH